MTISKENYTILKRLAELIRERLPLQGKFDQLECNCFYAPFRTVDGIENVGQSGDISDYLVLVDRERFYYNEMGLLMDRKTGDHYDIEYRNDKSLHSELGFMLFHAIFTLESEWENEEWATGIYISLKSTRFDVANKIELILQKLTIEDDGN